MSAARRILVPVDGSECSNRALDVAVSLAQTLSAGLVVGHVIDLARVAALSGGEAQLVPGCFEELQSEGRRIVAEAVERAAPRIAASSRIVQGSPVEEIERLAAAIAPSFIVMGTHGRTGIQRLLVGSVAEGVIRNAPVPVMLVPPDRRPNKPITESQALNARSLAASPRSYRGGEEAGMPQELTQRPAVGEHREQKPQDDLPRRTTPCPGLRR